MASTPSDRRPRNDHGSPQRADADHTAGEVQRAPHDRAEQLAEILAPLHERMLAAATLDDNPLADEIWDAPRDLDDLLVAEIEGLEDCLRRVERARRESIVRSAQHDTSHYDSPQRDPLVSFQSDEPLGPWGSSADAAPRQIGRFEIVRELGRGGLGVVLLAYDPVLKRRVALKIPRAEALLTAQLRQRFQREAQAAARLTHPHIVPVHEVGTIGPICFIAAAYVQGPSLADWLRAGHHRIEPHEAAELIAQLAEAMHYAHGQGVLHRDLKPGNILLEPSASSSDVSATQQSTHVASAPDPSITIASAASKQWVPKITDFGLAKLMDLAGDETRTGVILGTPAYMSPEQALGGKFKLGPASDVYSLGAMLYELLTGKPPFRGDSDAETLLHVSESLPVTPRRVQASIPTDLEAICLHCLEKDPAQRYGSAGALAADLSRFLAGEPTLARPLSPAKRLVRWARRQPAHAALAGLCLAALMSIVTGVVWHTRQLNRTVDLANRNAMLAEGNRQLSVKHELRANEQLYVAQMRLADHALHDGDLPLVHSLMNRYCPGEDMSHLRGIEWHVLRAEVDRAANTGDHNSTTIYDHPAEVYAVAFTPDGRCLLTGCQDGHLRIWEREKRRLLWDIPAHQSCINQVRVSPDGRHLATASCDATVGIWQVSASGPPVPLHRLPHTTPVRQVAFSPDGQQLVSQCDGRQITRNIVHGALYVWNVESGERVHFDEFAAPMGAHGLEWSPDGRNLVTLRDDWMTAFRTVDWSPHYSKRFPDHSKRPSVRRIAFQPVSGQLTMCAQDSIQQIDLDTGVESTVLETLNVGDFSWSADGRFVAVIDRDREGMVRLFDGWNAFRPLSFYQHHTGRMVELTFSRDGTQLASAGFDRRVCVTDLSTRLGYIPVVRQAIPLKPETVRAYDPSNLRLTWLQDGAVRRMDLGRQRVVPYDPKSSQQQESLTLGERVLDVPSTRESEIWHSLSARGTRATRNEEHQVTVADLEANTQVDIPPDQTTSVLGVLAFDQRPIAFLISDWMVSVFDLEAQRMIYTEPIEGGPTKDMTAELSPDGRKLLILDSPGSIRLVDLATASSQLVSDDTTWNSVAPTFSADSRFFALITNETFVSVWETESLERQQLLRPRQRPLHAVFSHDGRTLAVASERQLTFWNIAQGQEIVTLDMPAKPARLGLSPASDRLYWISETAENIEVYEWTTGDE